MIARPIAVPLNPSQWTDKKGNKIKGRPIVLFDAVFFSRARARRRVITPTCMGQMGQQDGLGVGDV